METVKTYRRGSCINQRRNYRMGVVNFTTVDNKISFFYFYFFIFCFLFLACMQWRRLFQSENIHGALRVGRLSLSLYVYTVYIRIGVTRTRHRSGIRVPRRVASTRSSPFGLVAPFFFFLFCSSSIFFIISRGWVVSYGQISRRSHRPTAARRNAPVRSQRASFFE